MPLYRIRDKLVLFVHIPKTGGTSIEAALESLGEGCMFGKIKGFPAPTQHFHAAIYEQLVPVAFCDLAFTVVRNPYARLISEFRYQAKDGKTRDSDLNSWITRTLDRYQKDQYVRHNHVRPQVEFVVPGLQVFRFEDGLEACWREIERLCEVQPSASLASEKRFPKSPLTISRATLERVARFYAEDFERFGYDPSDFAVLKGQKVSVKAGNGFDLWRWLTSGKSRLGPPPSA